MGKLFSDEYMKQLNQPDGLFLKAKHCTGNGLIVRLTEKPGRTEIKDKNTGEGKLVDLYFCELQSDGKIMQLTSGSAKLAKAFMDSDIDVMQWFRLKYEEKTVITAPSAEFPNGEEKTFGNWSVMKLDSDEDAKKAVDALGSDEMPPDFLK